MTLPAGVQPEEVRVLRKRGVLLPRSRSDKGDHQVTIKIEIPKSLTKKQKELIIEAFGNKSTNNDHENNTVKDENNAVNDENSEKKKSGFFDFLKTGCASSEKQKMSGKS